MDVHPVTGEIFNILDELDIYPAKHYLAGEDRLKKAILDIEEELEERIKYFKDANMLLEAQRIEQRCRYDLEMLREVGYLLRDRELLAPPGPAPGRFAPWTLIDYLPSDYLLVMDE